MSFFTKNLAVIYSSVLVTLFLCQSTVFAQQTPPEIFDFPSKLVVPDKLRRCAIRFTVQPPDALKPGSNPSVQIAGLVSSPGRWEALGSKGVCQIVFDKPLAPGGYAIALTYAAAGKSVRKECLLTVVESAFDEQSAAALGSIKPVFGEPLSVRTALPPVAAALRENLFLAYSLGMEQKSEIPYQESFSIPFVPAAARSVGVAVVWKHPQTGERLTLIEGAAETGQTKPTFAGTPVAELPPVKNKTLKSGEVEFLIKGASLNYAVPVDADERDPRAPKRTFAELGDVRVTEMGVEMLDERSKLQVFKGDAPDPSARFSPSPATVQAKGFFEDGKFTLTVKVRNVPKFADSHARSLRGTLVVKFAAEVTNRKAQKTVSAEALLPVPVNIPLGR